VSAFQYMSGRLREKRESAPQQENKVQERWSEKKSGFLKKGSGSKSGERTGRPLVRKRLLGLWPLTGTGLIHEEREGREKKMPARFSEDLCVGRRDYRKEREKSLKKVECIVDKEKARGILRSDRGGMNALKKRKDSRGKTWTALSKTRFPSGGKKLFDRKTITSKGRPANGEKEVLTKGGKRTHPQGEKKGSKLIISKFQMQKAASR